MFTDIDVTILKGKLQEKLREWKTPLEDGINYIKQPITLHSNSDQLVELEQCLSGNRIMIYADAGMGKTRMLKYIAQTWIDGNWMSLQKFKYVFLMPMRLIRERSIAGHIIEDIGLILPKDVRSLKQSLDKHEDKILFLLDSYEELAFQTEEIDRLIVGDLLERSTVIVTSRPGGPLTKLQARLDQSKCIAAQLNDLPEQKVQEIIRCDFPEESNDETSGSDAFVSIGFLQKPINLALAYYLRSLQGSHKEKPKTQTELFNQVLQHIMLAYSKHRKMKPFAPMAGAYLKNRNVPVEVRALFRVMAKKCYDQLKEGKLVLTFNKCEDISQHDFTSFGLFTAGPGTNSVVLPHSLFQEHFAALYLAADQVAWKALFVDAQKKSMRDSPRISLQDAVRPLDNVIKFLVALSPEIAEQVGSLIVVKQERIEYQRTKIEYQGTQCQNASLQYEQDLLRECSDESSQAALVAAIAIAPITVCDNEAWFREDNGLHSLLTYFSPDQRVEFFRRVYNCELGTHDGKSTIVRKNPDDRNVAWDPYVLGLVHLYSSSIQMEKLHIRTDCHLPVRLLSKHMTGVRQLRIEESSLCEDIPDYISALAMKRTTSSVQKPMHSTASLLERIQEGNRVASFEPV